MLKGLDNAISKWLGFNTPEQKKNALKVMEVAERDLAKISVQYASAAIIEGQEAPSIIPNDAYISIPSSTYVEVADGVFDRILEHSSDIKFDEEAQFSKQIRKMDFENNIVVMVKFKSNAFFGAHYHVSDEVIYCLRGAYIGSSNGDIYREGDIQVIPANQVHIFKPISSGFALIELKISNVKK